MLPFQIKGFSMTCLFIASFTDALHLERSEYPAHINVGLALCHGSDMSGGWQSVSIPSTFPRTGVDVWVNVGLKQDHPDYVIDTVTNTNYVTDSLDRILPRAMQRGLFKTHASREGDLDVRVTTIYAFRCPDWFLAHENFGKQLNQWMVESRSTYSLQLKELQLKKLNNTDRVSSQRRLNRHGQGSAASVFLSNYLWLTWLNNWTLPTPSFGPAGLNLGENLGIATYVEEFNPKTLQSLGIGLHQGLSRRIAQDCYSSWSEFQASIYDPAWLAVNKKMGPREMGMISKFRREAAPEGEYWANKVSKQAPNFRHYRLEFGKTLEGRSLIIWDNSNPVDERVGAKECHSGIA